jgi:Spy/CpxP family protein refolding chaperone
MNHEKCKGKKRHGRTALIAGSVITALALTAAVVTSCGGHRSFKNDPEKMRKFALWKVDDTLDDLDATESQKKQILGIADSVIRDWQKMKEHKEQDHEVLLAELEQRQPDATVFHDLLDRRSEQFNQLAHRTIDKALKAWQVLDRSQQAELLEEIRDHIDDHH